MRRQPTPSRLVELARALEVDSLQLTTRRAETAAVADLGVRAGLSRNEVVAALAGTRTEYDRADGGQ